MKGIEVDWEREYIIWKAPLVLGDYKLQKVNILKGSKLLSVVELYDNSFVLNILSPCQSPLKDESECYTIWPIRDGKEIRGDVLKNYEYLASVKAFKGILTWHIFYKKEGGD